MFQRYFLAPLAALLLLAAPRLAQAQTGAVGIGTTAPDASAVLDLTSTTKGLLPPRLSQAQRDAIASPAAGLTIYNTTTNKLNTWNGTRWTEPLTTTEQPYQAPSTTFGYTGAAQTYAVPPGVTSIFVNVVGAQGGGSNSYTPGGYAAGVQATLAVTPGEVLTLYVGGTGGDGRFNGSGATIPTPGGYNGGGTGYTGAGGGGGASDIRRGGTALTNRLITAGGGGGDGNSGYGYGGSSSSPYASAGSGIAGGGGGYTNSSGLGFGGQGGRDSGGGAVGGNGSLGQGGSGNGNSATSPYRGGGGGGGGYYGGGGGGTANPATSPSTFIGGGGGGGGSSYADASSASAISYNASYQSGNGSITITASPQYAAPALDGTNIVNVPGTWSVSGSNVYRPSGNVGIGTSTPGQKLEVAGQVYSNTGGFRFPDNTVQTTAAGAQQLSKAGSTISLTNGGSVTDADNQTLSISNNTLSLTNGGSVTLPPAPGDNLGNHTATTNLGLNGNWLSNAPGNANGLRVDNAGNVGIGVAPTAAGVQVSTGEKPSISTTAGVFLSGGAAGNPNIELRGTGGAAYLDFVNDLSTDYAARILSSSSGLGLYTGGSASPRLLLNPGGNLSLSSLGGSGTRMVVADADGNVSAQAVPSGDNLGNHTATTNLNLGTNLLVGPGGTGLGISSAGGVGIGTVADASAALDVSSTTKGLLPPRLNLAQRDAIASPAAGLTIYNTTTKKLNTWNGTSWEASLSATEQPYQNPTATFDSPGQYTYTVPAGVRSLQVDAQGAQGGTAAGGTGAPGGRVQTTLSVTPGEVLRLYVGGVGGSVSPTGVGSSAGGYNGGGDGRQYCGGGGGATDVRRGGGALGNRVVVAGGGGGHSPYCPAGAGGGLVGANGLYGAPGQGGSQSAGGAGGDGIGDGSLGQGGAGFYTGGGGGYYGGGGGGGRGGTNGGGGGGGSSFVAATGSSNTTHTQGYRNGNGQLILTPGVAYATPALSGDNFINVPGAWSVNGTSYYYNNGLVGIGTSTPGHPLTVQADNVINGRLLGFNDASGNDKYNFSRQAATGSGTSAVPGGLNLSESNVAAGRLFVQDGGNVGIGTTSPIAKLHVSGSAQATPTGGNTSYFSGGSVLIGPQPPGGTTARATAAYFDGGQVWVNSTIVAGALNTTSDRRIKYVIGLSDRAADLALLNRLRITDYSYIDQYANTPGVIKKVIAQEVEQVLPTAVSRSTQAIPNVYEKATRVSYAHGQLTVTTAKPHELPATGGRMRFYTPANENLDLEVTVVDAHTVRFASAQAHAAGLFVYGKYVDDFRSVDYDALTTLNVSATQELARKVEALEQQNAALKTQAASAEAQAATATATLETFEARLRRLEAATGGQAQQ